MYEYSLTVSSQVLQFQPSVRYADSCVRNTQKDTEEETIQMSILPKKRKEIQVLIVEHVT